MALFGLGRPSPEKLKASGDVEGLSRLLVSGDDRARSEALDALVGLATEPAFRQHNRAALKALAGAREPAIRRLTEILKGISPIEGGWRNAAVIEALVALGATDAVVGYFDAHAGGGLENGLFMLDVLALLTMHAMQRRDRPLLRKLLQAGAYEYREAQGRSFSFAHLEAELPRPASRSMEVMAELGGEGDLIELARSARRETVRHWTWGALGATGTAACLPLLLQAAETGGQQGSWAFNALLPRLSVTDLASLARHPRADIREPALVQLCGRDDPSGFETVLAAAASTTEKVSVAAVEALGRMRRTEAVVALAALLHSPSGPVWKAAAAALGAIGADAGISALLALGPERLLDEAALGAIAAAGAGPRLLESVRPRLDQLSPDQALDLVATLRGSLPAAELADLQETLARPHTALLADAGWGKRKAAIKALGKIGGPAAAQALRARQAHEEDYELSNEISTALAEAGRV
ncbi:MAG TPA: HEAT repeat domain-containing protein [Longimicrobiaceae bacterium]|nr:HEAT repeat domain-containing protein [Longimicrobiaceae bacterium]